LSNNLDVIYLDTNELIFCVKKIFVFSLILIFLLLIIILNFSTDNTDTEFSEKFQISQYAFPIIIVNGIIFSLIILYIKKILPLNFRKKIQSFFQFEVSKRISIIVIVVLIGILIAFNFNGLSNDETFVDYPKVEKKINLFEDGHYDIRIVTYFLLYTSEKIFQNVRVIPLIASMLLMIVTYLFTVQISQKRFAGLIAMALVLQSNIFLTYSSSSTYPNFWVLFYLTSLYFVNKKWFLSPIFFVFSIFSKYLTPIYIPVTLYHIAKSEISKNKKLITLGIYLSIPVIGIVLQTTGILVIVSNIEPNYDSFITGFKDFSKIFINDLIVLLFLIPLIVGLFLVSRRGLKEANTIMLFIFVVLLSASFIPGFFPSLNNHAYRFVPLIVFFSIGIGVLFSNKINLVELNNINNRKLSYVIFLPTLIIVLITMLSVIFPEIIEGHYRLVT